MNYYETYMQRYQEANQQQRKQAREHWTRIHAGNLASGRQDLTIFSAQHLAIMDIIDAEALAGTPAA